MPASTATALARVERLAIEREPKALCVVRVGKAEEYIVHVAPAHGRAARGERERVTKSAEMLAGTTNTILIHHDDIPALKEIVNGMFDHFCAS